LSNSGSEIGAMASVTLKDVAERAGVDVSTASRALNPEKSSIVAPATRLKVIEAAQVLGYRTNLQASSLRRGRTGIIGVIVADLSNPFIGPVIRGVAHALGGRGLLPIMTETHDSSSEFAMICDKLLAQRVDGVITTAARYGDRALLSRVAADVPTVLAVRGLPGSGIPSISHDDQAGGRMAAEHLLSLGHRRFAQLMGPQDIWSFEGRARGFREAIDAAGASCDDIRAQTPLPTIQAGRQLVGELLTHTAELPTAIFAHNDTIAIGALAVLREHGVTCPDDVSLMGYNDVPLTGHVDPPLTTIRLPGYELGRLAAELVISPSGGADAVAGTVQLAPEVVVRASTGPPPGGAT
jgi:LacI family transcriptional regulator